MRFHSEANMFSSKGTANSMGNQGTSIHHFTRSREVNHPTVIAFLSGSAMKEFTDAF